MSRLQLDLGQMKMPFRLFQSSIYVIASSLYEKILIREERVVVYKIRMDIAITTKLDPRGNKSGADCFSQNGQKSKYLIKSVKSPCTTLQTLIIHATIMIQVY